MDDWLPLALPGFEGVRRNWSAEHRRSSARVLPGEFYVTREDEVIVTLLGSCVSACIRDVRTGAGGLNHFMLPMEKGASGGWSHRSTRYGNFAMERMINELLALGAKRNELEVKVAGGGRMYGSLNHVGEDNAAFVREYLAVEGLTIVGEDLGGDWPRRIQFLPREGRMRVMRLPPIEVPQVLAHERRYGIDLETEPVDGSVELF